MNLLQYSPGYIRDKNLVKNNKPRKANSIHPSSLDRCSREIVYNMTNEPPKPKITQMFKRLLRNGNDGKYGHECILDDLGGAIVARDITLGIMNRCNGKLDGIIKHASQQAVLEIKRVNEKRFRAIKRMNKPERSMAMQLLYYMWRLELPG